MIKKVLFTAALMTGLSGIAAADDIENVAKVLQRLIPGKHPDAIADSVIPDLFQVVYGPEVIYISRDGRYVVQGDVISVDKRENITEHIRSAARLKLIQGMDPNSMIVFAPRQVKHTVTVFTDVDCVYCRAFHKQIAVYNHLGVRVRYVFFPRTGPNTESWFKAEQVWCSADRKDALTRAKLGQNLSSKVCSNNPVARDYALGEAIGLEGTPGIVASNGAMLGGYLTPDALIQALQENSVAN